jgi:ABC-type multidrug transport system fused ATPase/permease subunit
MRFKKIRELIRMFDFVDKKKGVYFIFLQFASIFSSILDTFSVGAIIPFIAIVTNPNQIMNSDKVKYFMQLLNINDSSELIKFITVLFVGLTILVSVVKWVQNYLNLRLTNQIASQLAFKLFNVALYQPYILHTQRNSSHTMFVVSRATELLNLVINPVVLFISSFFTILFISIFLILLNPFLITVTLSIVLTFYFVVVFITKGIIKKESEILSDSSIKLNKSMQEGLGGIRDILLDGTQQYFSENFHKQDSIVRNSNIKINLITNTPNIVIQTAGIAGIAILVTIISDGNSINSGLPMMGALALGYLRISPALQNVYSSWVLIKNGQVNIDRVINFLHEVDFTNISKIETQSLVFSNEIKLKNVSFRYNDNSPFAIKNLNLDIKKGERIGLVGKTGSGKSTLCDVMMGLLSTTNGSLQIDDIIIDQNNMRSWQNHIAHVPQVIYLSDGTIAENIAFGVSKENINYAKVEIAAQKAQIAETITNLEFGYQTLIGERGIRLSGGQRQRLGIARALYKEADVIFLDEATSALDDETESDLINAIEGLDNDLTIIMVAHRLTTLKNCNRILELNKGKIIQYESYELFMNKNQKTAFF